MLTQGLIMNHDFSFHDDEFYFVIASYFNVKGSADRLKYLIASLNGQWPYVIPGNFEMCFTAIQNDITLIRCVIYP